MRYSLNYYLYACSVLVHKIKESSVAVAVKYTKIEERVVGIISPGTCVNLDSVLSSPDVDMAQFRGGEMSY